MTEKQNVRLPFNTKIGSKTFHAGTQLAEVISSLRESLHYAELYKALRECFWEDSKLTVVYMPKQNVKLGAYCPSKDQLDHMIEEYLHVKKEPDSKDDGEVGNNLSETCVQPGYALVPLRLTSAMNEVLEEEGWQWADLLAAANAVTEEQHEAVTNPRLSQDEVREVFLKAGFTIKEGQTDLKPYVYEAARELENRVRQVMEAPAASHLPEYIEGGRESVDEALAIVESFGTSIKGLNDEFARQIILATEVRRLRGLYVQAVNGRSEFRDAYRKVREAILPHIGCPACGITHRAEECPQEFALAAAAPKAPATPVAYLDLGAGGYMDLGTDLTESQLGNLPKGRHMLAIIGTHGIDGYATAPAAPIPPAGCGVHPLSSRGCERGTRGCVVEHQAPAAPVADLAQLVKQLVRALRKAAPGNDLADKALDYLKCQGLLGSFLRAAPEAPPTHAGLLAAAAHIKAKAQAHAEEFGSYDPDTGAVEMSESNREHFDTLDELAEEICLMADKAAPQAPAAHRDDLAVDRFAAAMKEKLALARQKGRGGWEAIPADALSVMLREHVEKGDPRDVANFCMFLWNLGQPITTSQQKNKEQQQLDTAIQMLKRIASASSVVGRGVRVQQAVEWLRRENLFGSPLRETEKD